MGKQRLLLSTYIYKLKFVIQDVKVSCSNKMEHNQHEKSNDNTMITLLTKQSRVTLNHSKWQNPRRRDAIVYIQSTRKSNDSTIDAFQQTLHWQLLNSHNQSICVSQENIPLIFEVLINQVFQILKLIKIDSQKEKGQKACKYFNILKT